MFDIQYNTHLYVRQLPGPPGGRDVEPLLLLRHRESDVVGSTCDSRGYDGFDVVVGKLVKRFCVKHKKNTKTERGQKRTNHTCIVISNKRNMQGQLKTQTILIAKR